MHANETFRALITGGPCLRDVNSPTFIEVMGA